MRAGAAATIVCRCRRPRRVVAVASKTPLACCDWYGRFFLLCAGGLVRNWWNSAMRGRNSAVIFTASMPPSLCGRVSMIKPTRICQRHRTAGSPASAPHVLVCARRAPKSWRSRGLATGAQCGRRWDRLLGPGLANGARIGRVRARSSACTGAASAGAHAGRAVTDIRQVTPAGTAAADCPAYVPGGGRAFQPPFVLVRRARWCIFHPPEHQSTGPELAGSRLRLR